MLKAYKTLKNTIDKNLQTNTMAKSANYKKTNRIITGEALYLPREDAI